MFPSPPPPHPVWKPGVSSLSHPFLAFPCLVPRQQNPQAIHTQLRCCMLETSCAAASPVSSPSVWSVCSRADVFSVVSKPPPAQPPCPLLQIVPLKAEWGSHPGVPPGSLRKLLMYDGGAGRRGMRHFWMIRGVAVTLSRSCAKPRPLHGGTCSSCPSHVSTQINLLL